MRLIDADRLMDRLRGNVLIDVTPRTGRNNSAATDSI